MRANGLLILVLCFMTTCMLLVGCGGSQQMAGSSGARGPADPIHGQQLFQQNCSTCHGGMAQGLPHNGANLRKSRFIAEASDQRLIQFVKVGRIATDPENRSGVLMPPLGGNRTLDEAGLLDIIAHLRNVQQEARLDPPEEDETPEAREASAKL